MAHRKSTSELRDRVEQSEKNSGAWTATTILTGVAGVAGAILAAPMAAAAIPIAGATALAAHLYDKDAKKHKAELNRRGEKQPSSKHWEGAADRTAKTVKPGMGGGGFIGDVSGLSK